VERVRGVSRRSWLSLASLLLVWLTGCATPKGPQIPPTDMQQATEPYPPDQLVSVGIARFESDVEKEEGLEEQHSNVDIRKAELEFMPYHLKSTLENSGFWGQVRVVPPESSGMDLSLRCTVLYSNGERLKLRAEAVDSLGFLWMDRTYHERIEKEDYPDAVAGDRDPFQDLYNAIANDLAAVRRRMDALNVRQLRRATELKFAAELVPDAYGEYLREEDGQVELLRLPAEDDPLWQKVEQISGRNQIFFDALNASYEPYYLQIWQPYLDWRRYNLIEQVSLREAKNRGMQQALTGALLIAAAILLEVEGVDNTDTLRDVLVLAGSQVVINGVNISKAAVVHEETLKELSDSFSSDARSVRVELEGQTVKLEGTVEEQMAQWRDLLRRVVEAEQAEEVFEE